MQAELEVAGRLVSQLQADVTVQQAAMDSQAQELILLKTSAEQREAALKEVNVQAQQKQEWLSEAVAELTVRM